jgi:hypothetical protein
LVTALGQYYKEALISPHQNALHQSSLPHDTIHATCGECRILILSLMQIFIRNPTPSNFTLYNPNLVGGEPSCRMRSQYPTRPCKTGVPIGWVEGCLLNGSHTFGRGINVFRVLQYSCWPIGQRILAFRLVGEQKLSFGPLY